MNMLRFVKKNLLYAFLFGLICIPLYAQKFTPEQLQLSDEDINFFKEAQKEVAKYVDNLPTEASLKQSGYTDEQIAKMDTREKFDKEVERLSQMSEEELLQEIEKAISEVSAPQEKPEPVAPPAPIPSFERETPVEPIIPKPTISGQTQQKALELIDQIINSITNFMAKAQVMLQLAGKIDSWQKEGKLRGWPTTLKWSTFKTQVEDLQAKLHRVKDRDPVTGRYRYLEDFVKDESLQNNLMKIKQGLTDQEPKIILSPLGIDKMTTQARLAVRNVLMNLYEGIHTLGIPSALDKIFEKFEPTAKKIKESEEAAAKRALEQAKLKPTPTTVTVGGRPRTYETGFEMPSRYDRGGYEPLPDYTQYRPTEEKKAAAGAPGAPGAKPAEAAKAAGAPKTEAAKPEDKKPADDKAADRYESEFLNALESFKEQFEEHSKLVNLEKHVNKDVNEMADEELVSAITSITRTLRKAISSAKNLKRRFTNLKEDQKKYYRKNFKDALKEVRSDFDKISAQINNLQKANKASILFPMNPAQQIIWKSKFYSYFGKEYATDLSNFITQAKEDEQKAQKSGDKKAIAEATQKLDFAKKIEALKNTADINDLKSKIQELKKVVDEL